MSLYRSSFCFGGLRIAHVVERATQKPTLICMKINCTHRQETYGYSKPCAYTPRDIYRCFVLTTFEKLRSFQSQEQSVK
ncbi:MAG: hypothetical protein ACI3ZY_14715 [Parabacteroides sp.]